MTSSYELTKWQQFFIWRKREDAKRKKEREFTGDDD